MRLGLYRRYSLLVGGDDALERQDEDGQDYAAEFGGEVVKTYEDKKSAWRKKRIVQPDGRVILRVIRPDYANMLADLRAGVIDGAVVYDLDRLTRDLRDLEDAIEVVELYGRPIVGPGVDLTTDHGRANARAQAVSANKASQDTSRRVKRAHRQQAERGVPVGSRRPFGWKADKRTLEPVEAEALRVAVRRIIQGVPPAAIIREWDEAGFLSATGVRWRKATLMKILRNPRLCGLRGRGVQTPNEHGQVSERMEVVTRRVRRDGQVVTEPVTGQWEPIISVSEWETLTAVIGDHTTAARGSNARRYLLTAILRCGLCGGGMRCSPPSGTRTSPTYQCAGVLNGGCGKVARNGPLTERHVLAAVFAKIELETAQAVADIAPWGRQAELDEVKATIAATNAAWTARPRQIDPQDYFSVLPDLREQERELVADRNAYQVAAAKARSRPADIEAEWETYTLAHQRAIIAEHLRAVVVHPAGKGRRPFNPDLLELVWRD
ncbi:recombinase family protein [Pseudofrankia sp. BMG5.37]|uniref:recombinase family protein n=1 Tax=Pseudofrankia sp. BMG5.37 TaxID=3050035 RepID=UPI0028962B41|nr:recombinase family protein [Pseudofrankia sp. BMG5.37]MDT3440967.1 recombinase family protein [Pseudofrankia sp. BMG5.37]